MPYPAHLPGIVGKNVKADGPLLAFALVQGAQQWSYILIYGDTAPTMNLQQVIVANRAHFNLPIGVRITSLTSCARHLLAIGMTASGAVWYSFHGPQTDRPWRQLDQVQLDSETRLGPIDTHANGTSTVIVMNVTWKCVDLITFGMFHSLSRNCFSRSRSRDRCKSSRNGAVRDAD